MKTKYFALSYRGLPDTEFICDCNNKLRLKATRIKDPSNIPLVEGIIGVSEAAFFIFENVSSISVDKNHVFNAIEWFKAYLRIPSMRVVEIRK